MSFRCSGSRENLGVRLLVITHREIPKYEIRKGLAWVSLGVSVFWQPGNPRVSLLVHVSPEIPMGEVPKEQYADRLRDFGTSEIRMLKGVFPCTRISRTPDLRSPEMA
jgi:hypothetical protein